MNKNKKVTHISDNQIKVLEIEKKAEFRGHLTIAIGGFLSKIISWPTAFAASIYFIAGKTTLFDAVISLPELIEFPSTYWWAILGSGWIFGAFCLLYHRMRTYHVQSENNRLSNTVSTLEKQLNDNKQPSGLINGKVGRK